VTFTIDRSGNLISDKVTESTGFPLLDEAAIAMLHRAQPFPPAPAELSDDSFTFTLPVIFRTGRPTSTIDAAKDAAQHEVIEKATAQ
jgi:protein TonB